MDFKPPTAVDLKTGNVAETWRRWKRQFQIYFEACEHATKGTSTQCALLLHTAGPEAMEISETFTWAADEDKTDYKMWVAKFDNYCEPRKNVVFERYQFWSRNQMDDETCDTWVTELRKMAKRCEFVEEETMLRDKVVFGIKDIALKERLLREPQLTLLKALDICRAAETSRQQARAMTSSSTSSQAEAQVNLLKKHSTGPGKNFSRHSSQHINSCRFCGRSHERGHCPAYGKVCKTCHGRNHFDSVCEKGSRRPTTSISSKYGNNGKFKKGQRGKSVNAINETFENDSIDDGLFIGALGHEQSDKWQDYLVVQGIHCNFKLDTGADANVLPKHIVQRTGHMNKICPTNQPLRAFGGSKILPLGTVDLPTLCPRTNISCVTTYYVTETADIPILGKHACEHFNLVQRVYSAEEISLGDSWIDSNNYDDVFTGLGEYSEPYNIAVDSEVRPIIQRCRKVPYSKLPALKSTLDRLEQEGVIATVDCPTDWVHNLVITEKKNGSMRICLDPKPLNVAIKREIHTIPTADDVQAQLCGKSVFTVVDMKDSYWQVRLDEPSSYLCTFHTPWGRKRFLRMPFGISSAGEVMQKRNEHTFGDIQGVYVIADDLIIAGRDEQQHDKILHRVMLRAREKGVRFNRSKLQFKLSQVSYMGNVISAAGLQACPKKIDSILNMPVPSDKPALQRLLGMIRYLAQFIPNESTLTAPLRSLLKKDSHWHWHHEHDKAFNDIKQAIARPTLLHFFDVSKPVVVQADSSQSGLGACIMQESHPIAFASRALTSAEANYSQIEKELLAICFACHKFHQYIYGREVEVHSDHRPLESIFKKPMAKAAPRLQRMLLQLQRYVLKVTYVPGKLMYVADTLSRAYVSGDPSIGAAEDVEIMVHQLIESLPITPAKRQEFQDATEKDWTMRQLMKTIANGWPKSRKSVSQDVQPYWNIRDQLHTTHGLVFFGERLVVPSALRPEMLSVIHESHLGTAKSKARAREVLYWPNMLADIERLIGKCEICVSLRPNQTKEPMIPHQIPARPWQKLAADIMTLDSKDYLVLTDYYSKYPEIAQLERKTASCVILHLKSIMARHGIPDLLCTDNMPFNSSEFLSFAQDWGFTLITSSPTYAQSNGMAEKTVQTLKSILTKATLSGKDPYIALLEYRNSPITGMTLSPAQMLMSRRLKGKLPSTATLLRPKVCNPKNQLQRQQERQKQSYDKGAKHLAPLRPGDSVHFRKGNRWKPAVVIAKHMLPRSYIISCDGMQLRRNRRHLLYTPGIRAPTVQVSSKNYLLDDDISVPIHVPPPPVIPPQLIVPLQPAAQPLPVPQVQPPVALENPHGVNEEGRTGHQRPSRARRTPAYLKDYSRK